MEALKIYRDIIIDRLSEEAFSIYNDDPFWNTWKQTELNGAIRIIDEDILKTPKALQLEFLYWGIAGKLLGEFRVDDISTVECFVFSGKAVKRFWDDYIDYTIDFFIKGRMEFSRKRLLAPNFWRFTPDRRLIKPEELEYIIHKRQLEYGFRDDPLPEVNPYVCTFDPIVEKEKMQRYWRIINGKEEGSPTFYEENERKNRAMKKKVQELYYNID